MRCHPEARFWPKDLIAQIWLDRNILRSAGFQPARAPAVAIHRPTDTDQAWSSFALLCSETDY
jgi:hypothetical protein